MSDGDVNSTSYAVRLHPKAVQHLEEERRRLAALSGERIGEEWETGLLQTIAKLAYQAPFLPAAEESHLFPAPVHILRYQRRRGAPTYRVLFTIRENGDGPRVVVLAIRHGARAPMTSEEADAIEL